MPDNTDNEVEINGHLTDQEYEDDMDLPDNNNGMDNFKILNDFVTIGNQVIDLPFNLKSQQTVNTEEDNNIIAMKMFLFFNPETEHENFKYLRLVGFSAFF